MGMSTLMFFDFSILTSWRIVLSLDVKIVQNWGSEFLVFFLPKCRNVIVDLNQIRTVYWRGIMLLRNQTSHYQIWLKQISDMWGVFPYVLSPSNVYPPMAHMNKRPLGHIAHLSKVFRNKEAWAYSWDLLHRLVTNSITENNNNTE